MHGEVTGGRPQIKLTAGGVALEAAVAIGYQIDPELAALAADGLVDRARATEPTAVAASGNEAQQRQDLVDGDLGSQLGKVDGRHDRRTRQVEAEQRRGSGNQPLAFRDRFVLGVSATAGKAGCWARWAR